MSRRRPGRPSTAAAIRELVIRIATDNPAWGSGACQASWSGSATRSLPARCGRSCMTRGSAPAPRRMGLTWKEFLAVRARGILVAGFVYVDTVLLRRI
jgi:putative transposase